VFTDVIHPDLIDRALTVPGGSSAVPGSRSGEWTLMIPEGTPEENAFDA
jgi:hypothetical protein